MLTLRITQSGPNIEAAFEADGLPRQTQTRPFSLQLSSQDAEDIRWYLENYLVYPVDPLPKTAARMKEIGQELFRGILHGSDVWSSAKRRLEETRVEVESDIARVNRLLVCRPIRGLANFRRPRPPEYWPVDALSLAENLLVVGRSAA